MFPLLKREKSSGRQHFLVLDIGADMIKALVCEAAHTHTIIKGVGKVAQRPSAMSSSSLLDLGSVIEHSAAAIELASQQAHAYPNEVVMGIAGELVRGMTRRLTHVRKEPQTKIDLSELKHIVHKIQWRSFEETRRCLAQETGFSEPEIKLVNAAVVDVRVDGFRVGNPIGFQGKEVEISIFNAFAPLVHFGALQTIAAELDLNLVALMAEPYSVARALTGDNALGANGIVIDIGSSSTDIAVVRNGSLEATKMFSIGGRTFTKRLAATLAISIEEAEAVKRTYSFGKLEKHSEDIVREAMQTDCEVWLAGVILTLAECNYQELPSTIYLCGGGSQLPEIKAALQSKEWIGELPFAAKPALVALSPLHIPGVKDASGSLSGPDDVTPVALASAGRELIAEEHLMTTVLKKVIRLMQL